jgi:thiosulfate/3-mercaptopyruvate sulfurtransferase
MDHIAGVLSRIGITPETHVAAYDDEGGGKAARLLWTLEVIGHPGGYSLLNGGLHALAHEGHSLTAQLAERPPSTYTIVSPSEDPVATRDFILSHLHDPAVALWDARSPDEYTGHVRYAQRGGHIPGAKNMEWTEAMDRSRNLRLRPNDELLGELERLGITRDKTVVTYCQSHHRSAFTWFVLHFLGFRAKGYPGSWSEWGNEPDLPVER